MRQSRLNSTRCQRGNDHQGGAERHHDTLHSVRPCPMRLYHQQSDQKEQPPTVRSGSGQQTTNWTEIHRDNTAKDKELSIVENSLYFECKLPSRAQFFSRLKEPKIASRRRKFKLNSCNDSQKGNFKR